MSAYRNISISFWTDSKVDDDFTPEDKYFFLYLLTNPHTNICGCYEISTRQMERETGYNADTVTRLINRMQNVHNVIRYSEETKEILIIKWSRYNWSKSEKLKKAVEDSLKYIKNSVFRRIISEILNGAEPESVSVPESVTVSVTDVSIGYQYPMDTVSDNNNKTAFKAPTVDEVRAYCQERQNSIDPERFINYYEAKGWMLGKDMMKDWKAAVRSWEKKEKEHEPNKSKNADNFNNFSFDDKEIDDLFKRNLLR